MKTVQTLFTAIVLLCSTALSGQHGPEVHQEIEARKVAFLSQKLSLTTSEAQTFWPIYNEYSEQMHNLRRARKKSHRAQKQDTSLSDAELEASIREQFELERGEIAIREKYFDLFKTVLSMEKIARLYNLEHEFKRELLREMRENCKRGK
ncbi:MAG: hypothetical protein EA392_00845 [Cryomorphaceae bacterium]|nr:MAG: hypothetical protein EA392_00845 [Cryomorphaceae bacterium]